MGYKTRDETAPDIVTPHPLFIRTVKPSLQLVGTVGMQDTSSHKIHLLFVHLGFGGPRAQMPAAAALVVALVLNSDFAEMT